MKVDVEAEMKALNAERGVWARVESTPNGRPLYCISYAFTCETYVVMFSGWNRESPKAWRTVMAKFNRARAQGYAPKIPPVRQMKAAAVDVNLH